MPRLHRIERVTGPGIREEQTKGFCDEKIHTRSNTEKRKNSSKKDDCFEPAGHAMITETGQTTVLCNYSPRNFKAVTSEGKWNSEGAGCSHFTHWHALEILISSPGFRRLPRTILRSEHCAYYLLTIRHFAYSPSG